MDVDPVSGTPHDREGKEKGEGKEKEKGDKDKEEKKDAGQHPPAKKYRMTESMKAIVWQLVLLSNECCRLENEKK
jgi:predicted transcriptional regulator